MSILSSCHLVDRMTISYLVTQDQGLTLVHFSARRKLFLVDTSADGGGSGAHYRGSFARYRGVSGPF